MHRRNCPKAIVWGVTSIASILLFSSTVYSAPPGIETVNNGQGVTTWNEGLNHYVKIYDQKAAIADGGASHTVTVTYPNGGPPKTLNFQYKSGTNVAFYGYYDGSIPRPMNVATYSGDYVFKVTRNSDGEWSEAIDNLQVSLVSPLNERTFSPGLGAPEFIVASFDDVYANDALYDNFSGGFDSAKWISQPSEVVSQETQRVANGTITVDGERSDWSGISPSLVDAQNDSLGGSTADIRYVYVAMDDTYAYVMVETYGQPIHPTAQIETYFNYKTGQHAWHGPFDDLYIGIGASSLSASRDDNLDGTWESYPITGYTVVRGNVMEARIPLSELENAQYFNPTFVNIWTPTAPPTKGDDPSNIGQPIVGEVHFEKTYATASGTSRMAIKNPAGVYQLKSKVRVDSHTGETSAAGIGAHFCRINEGNVWAALGLQGDQAVYAVMLERTEGNHTLSVPLLPKAVLGPATLGNSYELSIRWNEGSSILTFSVVGLNDSVNYTGAFQVANSVGSPTNPSIGIGIMSSLAVETTTPTFDWDEVAGASYYQVAVNNSNNSRIYTGFAKTPPYTLPPGILKPYGVYTYRIEAINDHWFFGWDNVTVSDSNKTKFYVATPNEAQDPYIDLHINAFTFTGQIPNSWIFFLVRILDAQGVPSNIQSVQVVFPDSSTTVDLYLDYAESPTIGRYRGSYYGPYQEGEYTFTVIDRDEHKATKTDVLSPNPIAYPSQASLSPAHTAVLGGTAANFDWEDVPGASVYYLSIQDKTGARVFADATTESHYALPAGLLKETAYYRYAIETYREFPENGLDNISQIPESTGNGGGFFTTGKYGTQTPVLNLDRYGVAVFQAPHPVTGDPVYELDFYALITDADGVPENIEYVEVTFPDGSTKHLLKFWNEQDPNYFHSEIYADPSSIPTGTYTFKVRDFEGHEVVAQDTLPSVIDNVLPAPTGLSPPDRALLNNTTPTIRWNPVPGATYYRIRIMEPWRLISIHWSSALTTTHYTLPLGLLSPNTAYSYRVYAFRDPIDAEIDFYSANQFFSRTNYHFTTGNQTPWGSISGQIVTDVTGQSAPVVGATVTIVELGQTTTSGSDGSFLFTGVLVGTYTLKVEKNNFQTLTYNNIQVSDGQTTAAPQSLMDLLPRPIPGDSNQNGTIGLEDAIFILQVLSGAR
jgi:hypothetical protein